MHVMKWCHEKFKCAQVIFSCVAHTTRYKNFLFTAHLLYRYLRSHCNYHDGFINVSFEVKIYYFLYQ